MLRYVGPGFIPGVPARDLSDEEAAQFAIPQLLASGLYIRVENKQEQPVRETKVEKPGPVTVNVKTAELSGHGASLKRKEK